MAIAEANQFDAAGPHGLRNQLEQRPPLHVARRRSQAGLYRIQFRVVVAGVAHQFPRAGWRGVQQPAKRPNV